MITRSGPTASCWTLHLRARTIPCYRITLKNPSPAASVISLSTITYLPVSTRPLAAATWRRFCGYSLDNSIRSITRARLLALPCCEASASLRIALPQQQGLGSLSALLQVNSGDKGSLAVTRSFAVVSAPVATQAGVNIFLEG